MAPSEWMAGLGAQATRGRGERDRGRDGQGMTAALRRTTACSRLPPASARTSLPLPAAAEAQR